MKFALNAVSDTLPHRSNLKKWKKLSDDQCPLCKGKQTLSHVLNSCSKALELRRYTDRHDAVLSHVVDLLVDFLPANFKITSDLPDSSYNFPDHICASDDLRPDIVIWSDVSRQVWLVELTVCFETNAVDASIRKAEHYSGLKHAIESSKYTCQVLPIQVGSRGYIDSTSFDPLQELFKIPNRQFHQALLNVICITLKKSFNIWLSRNTIA